MVRATHDAPAPGVTKPKSVTKFVSHHSEAPLPSALREEQDAVVADPAATWPVAFFARKDRYGAGLLRHRQWSWDQPNGVTLVPLTHRLPLPDTDGVDNVDAVFVHG